MHVNMPIRTALRKALQNEITTNYYRAIPIDQIDKAMKSKGFFVACEDGTPWEGVFCGEQGNCILRLAAEGDTKLVDNFAVSLSWYKMASGRYEIVTYIS